MRERFPLILLAAATACNRPDGLDDSAPALETGDESGWVDDQTASTCLREATGKIDGQDVFTADASVRPSEGEVGSLVVEINEDLQDILYASLKLVVAQDADSALFVEPSSIDPDSEYAEELRQTGEFTITDGRYLISASFPLIPGVNHYTGYWVDSQDFGCAGTSEIYYCPTISGQGEQYDDCTKLAEPGILIDL